MYVFNYSDGWANFMTTHDKQRENHAKDQDDNKPNHGKSRKKGK